MSLPILSNAIARRIFLDRHALAEAPSGAATGSDLAALIARIGFVQVDSINTVARAHHMILFSRRQSYRPEALKSLMEQDRGLFEHWTHDASILPIDLFPHWQNRFAAAEERLRSQWQKWFRDGYEAQFDTILNRIATHGPVTTSDVGEGEQRSKGGWWDWHPSKIALEWMWRTGVLSISGRNGFQKIYDLTETVIPAQHRGTVDLAETIDWACTSALDHLGFGTAAEIAAYWNAIGVTQARDWCGAAMARGDLIEVEVTGAEGSKRRHFARSALLDEAPPEPTSRLRILSPFDPMLRDRARAERLFGFRYRIEVFVPEAKRQYGYYVFPVMEGARLIGRIDVKAWRDSQTLRVRGYWPEAATPLTLVRKRKLEAELARYAKFTDCQTIAFDDGWLREPAG